MKKENEGAYGFDRSQPDYAKKVLEESRRQISDAARTLGSISSSKKAAAARENGRRPVKPGSRPRGRPKELQK